MNKNFITIIISIIIAFVSNAQIVINGNTNDWLNTNEYLDDSNDGNNLELLEIEISNDNDFLFIRLKTVQEVDLNENSNLRLYIDTDNNPSTGFSFDNLGAELAWNFDNGEGVFYYQNQNENIEFSDIFFRALPTHTATNFEIAIKRDSQIAGNSLFSNNAIAIKIAEPNGDIIPNSNETLLHNWISTPIYEPLALAKQNETHIRLMSWNTKLDGLLDSDRSDKFKKVIETVNPNIIAFQEVWDMTITECSTFLQIVFPYQNWYITKNEDDNNIVASQYPITETHSILEGKRLQAVKIDLPEIYEKDLVIINAHLKCCGGNSNDDQRQFEVDAIAKFILDLKIGEAPFTIENETPILIVGDMNMVGDGNQRETLINGTIENTNTFGYGGALDWDDSAITDLTPIQTEKPLAITWRNDFSSFSPGKLDYIFYTDAVLEIKNSYVLQIETMENDRLQTYNFDGNETNIASDHFPLIADLKLQTIVSNNNLVDGFEFEHFQNASAIFLKSQKKGLIKIYDQTGKLLYVQNKNGEVAEILKTKISAKLIFLVFENYTKKILLH